MRAIFGVLFAVVIAKTSAQEIVLAEEGDFKVILDLNNADKTDGPKPQPGDRVAVRYAGKFADGKEFDSNFNRSRPFIFEIGKKKVIKCWEKAFPYLSKGMKAEVYCPSEYAYGSGGAGRIIPPNSDLIFNVQLVDINPVETP